MHTYTLSNKLKGVGDSLFTHTQCIVDYNPQCIPLFFCFFFIFLFFFQFSPFFSFIFFKIIFVDFTFLILSWLKISLCNFFPLKYCGLLQCFPAWFFFFLFLFFKIIFVDFIFLILS